MNTNLNEITTLTQLHTALTNKPIKAQLGEKGGRKFTIGNEQKSLHEIVTQYLSILKTVDLTDSKNRKIAANILEKLQTIKEDHDFTENLTLYKKINLGFRKTIGNLYHGSQNDLQKKFLRAVNSNLKINEKNYNSYTVRVELKKLMKRISIEASLSPELIIEQQKLSKQLEGIQKDNKTIKNINLDDLKKLKSSNSKELKELQVWCKKLKTEIASHPEIDKKLIVRLDQFSDMAALLAYTKKDIQQIDITLNDAVDKSKRPYSYEGLSIPDASEFIYRSSPQSRPLEQIEDLGELNRALTRGKVTETNETIYAHLGKEGGRRFIIGNQEYSFHDIANKSLLLLEKTNLTKAENRDSAKNILEKLYLMKNQQPFLRNNSEEIRFLLRKTLGGIVYGRQDDLNVKFFKVMKRNLENDENSFYNNSETKKIIFNLMKKTIIHVAVSNELTLKKDLLSDYFQKHVHRIFKNRIIGIQSKKNLKTNFEDNKAITTEELRNLMEYTRKLEKKIKLSSSKMKNISPEISPKTANEISTMLNNFLSRIELIIKTRDEIQKLEESLNTI